MPRWKAPALEAVREGMSWQEFNALYPEFSYDAWEVKRRRVQPLDESPGIKIDAVPVGQYAGPTICYWDLETTYSTQPRLLSGAGIDGLGNLKVFDLRELQGPGGWLDDHAMAVAIRDYLESFNILAGWNSKLFDVPVLNGRLSFWRERPLHAQMHVDMMYYATGQFMRIGRKSLESVSSYFESPNRKTPLSPRLWDHADHGDMEAYQQIIDHNIADVKVTRDLWAHLGPFVRNVHRAG